MKAIIANTIATAPKPTFVKGVTLLLRPDGFFVVFVVVVLLNQRRIIIIVGRLLFTNGRVRTYLELFRHPERF
jgi:hypothetical protein